ncbi:hypothetical protein GWK47_024739 [Chionoecetes opilio]|uniref:Uncharacterized protein n=1 Tax=Chionoecetes opilio TaxID=41210 RepID=A0A8J4XKU5_CHIOP|nr:hypothetical protein GWK47_024739 [Chionoecetes opilio]
MAQGFNKGAKTPLEMLVKPLKIVVKRLSKATELRLLRKLYIETEMEGEIEKEGQGETENPIDESLVSKRTRDKQQRKPKRIPQLCLGDASKNGGLEEGKNNGRGKGGQRTTNKKNKNTEEIKRSKGERTTIEKIEDMKEIKRIPQLCLVRMPDPSSKNKGMEEIKWRNKGQMTTTEKNEDMEEAKRSRNKGPKTTTKKHVGLIDGKRSTRGKKGMENAEKDTDIHDNTKEITEEKQQDITEEKHDLRKRVKTEDKKTIVVTQGRQKKRNGRLRGAEKQWHQARHSSVLSWRH